MALSTRAIALLLIVGLVGCTSPSSDESTTDVGSLESPAAASATPATGATPDDKATPSAPAPAEPKTPVDKDRSTNPTPAPPTLAAGQYCYFGEDDIIRFEDVYQRA